jgi:hypothetical protein
MRAAPRRDRRRTDSGMVDATCRGDMQHFDQLDVESHDWRSWPELATVWSALASARAHASFFLAPETV